MPARRAYILGMDSVTHGLLGASLAYAAAGRRAGRGVALLGAVAAMSPDLDVFLRVPSDPMLGLHRHFTHALAFVPVGALIVTAPLLLFRTLRPRALWLYLAALVAYLSHPLLDSCTSTGVFLFIPFSRSRPAWDLIAIVDPTFTVALLAGLVVAMWRRSRRAAGIGVACAVAYLGVGAIQHGRAAAVQRRLAAERGDVIAHGRVIPTPINLFIWRSIYRDARGDLHADSVRVPFFSSPTVRRGRSLPAFSPEAVLAAAALHPDRLRRDLGRYQHRTEGLWAVLPDHPDMVFDMRLSGDPADFVPLWGIQIDPAAEHPVLPVAGLVGPRRAWTRLWPEITGRDPRYQPVP